MEITVDLPAPEGPVMPPGNRQTNTQNTTIMSKGEMLHVAEHDELLPIEGHGASRTRSYYKDDTQDV
jgi:hypothetical protein